MPTTSVAFPGNPVGIAQAAAFIPQLWEDDVIAAYKTQTVFPALVRKISMKGRSGNAMNLPRPVRSIANIKAPGAAVQAQRATEGTIQLVINRHFESSRFLEDITGIQALPSLRRFYTDDMGYALARQKDRDISLVSTSFNGGTAGALAYAAAYIGGDGATLYTSGAPNSTALTDVGIRRVIQRLDENDVPMDGRVFVVTAGTKNVLTGLSRFTEQAFVGEVGAENVIRNGRLGDIYGMGALFSNNLQTATGGGRVNMMFHREAIILGEQLSVRMQTQYKLEYLADLLVADTLYGTVAAREGVAGSDVPSAGFALVTPA